MSKAFNIFVLAAIFLSLSGFSAAVLPTRRISGAYSDVSDVAVAVDPYGGQHTLTMECSHRGTLTCYWAYRYLDGYAPPVVITRDAPAGTLMRYPDVAPDNEGGVVLVWQECQAGYINCVDYYAFGTPFGAPGFPVVARLDLSRNSSGPPKLAARNQYVYAVYLVPDGAGSALRYRQLSPLDASGGWVSPHPGDNISRRDPSLAIAADGILYVVWAAHEVGVSRIWVNDNYGVTGDMVHGTWVGPGQYYLPAAAVDSDDDRLFFTWLQNDATAPLSDGIIAAWCDISSHDCSGSIWQALLAMPVEKHWEVRGGPAITTDAQRAYIAFSANNDDTGSGYEIFRLSWNPDSVLQAPVQISQNSLINDQPFIEMLNGHDLIVWRIDIFPPAYGDILMWSEPFGEIVPVRELESGNGRPGADMDSNGTQMGLVWLEMHEYSYGQQDEAWMAFNRYGMYLPLLVAP